ncbi:MAG: divalent-cation tolerance protein CutA [Alphaproteobacteria bacterium]|nr:divalent-cation tolerance protein CutA [Alphaproteobacteria bacterium]
MADLIFIYVPCRDSAEAEKIARVVIEKKLAACANIFPAMQSIYPWEGEICVEQEAVLILKTAAAQFKAVEEAVRSVHSYELPCIAALNVTDVNDAYAAWIHKETTK